MPAGRWSAGCRKRPDSISCRSPCKNRVDFAPPVDSGYRGEIHAIISNISSRTQAIKKGVRIGQLIITPVVIADFVSGLGEERGTGGFGSTGE